MLLQKMEQRLHLHIRCGEEYCIIGVFAVPGLRPQEQALEIRPCEVSFSHSTSSNRIFFKSK